MPSTLFSKGNFPFSAVIIGMSLQIYTANYRPGMHTTALSVVRVKEDLKTKIQTNKKPNPFHF